MTSLLKKEKLNGVITPLTTPLLPEGELDVAGLKNVIDYVVDGGVTGIFILGTTGEGPSLSSSLKKKVIEETCSHVNKRVPVLVGISDASLEESVKLTVYSKEKGADAVVTAPPFYYVLSPKELHKYFITLANQSELPVYLYNMPAQTKMTIDVGMVDALADHPNIYGIKDSSGNAVYYNSLIDKLKRRTDFSVFVGPDEMMASTVLAGGDGGVNSGSNMFPHLYVKLYEAARDGDLGRVKELQRSVMLISQSIYNGVKGENSFLKGIKTTLSLLGIINGSYTAQPLTAHSEPEVNVIRENLEQVKADLQAHGLNLS